MTRTEAIEWLTAIRDKYIHGGDQFYDNQRRVAIDYAVTVLKNIEQPPKTNADRIRAMSDEELADFLADKYVTESCLRLNDKGYEATEIQKRAIKHTLYCTWMKWLKQPVEGGNE